MENESKEFFEEGSFEKELYKRLRRDVEEYAQDMYINFTQEDKISGVAKKELLGIDDILYEYYNYLYEQNPEWKKLSEERQWDILEKKVNEFFQNFTDSKLKEMYEHTCFTEIERKYMQLKWIRSIEDNTSAKNALVEILIRRKFFEIFGKEKVSEILKLVSEKSFEGKKHAIQLLSDNPFGEGLIEKYEKEIESRTRKSLNDRINCGGYALKIDQCFFTPTRSRENRKIDVVEEDAQVISSYIEKFPFVRLLGNTKLEDDEYMVIYRARKGHAKDGRHFIRVENDGTITEKDGNGPIGRFENWSVGLQNEDETIEVIFAVKENHRMFGYTSADVNDNCTGLNFEQSVEQAINEKRNVFEYHCKKYFLKKDAKENVVVCSEKGEIVADVILEDTENENIECIAVTREGYERTIENYEGDVKPIIIGGKLINYDSFRKVKCKDEDVESSL